MFLQHGDTTNGVRQPLMAQLQHVARGVRMAQTILVTGGAGFIGSHLVDRLLAHGHRVRVLDNLDAQVHGNLREKGAWPVYYNNSAEYQLGDVRDAVAVQQALTGVDAVVHLAAAVGVGQSMYEVERYVDVNIRGTATILDVIANQPSLRERLRKLVVASSMSNYGEGAYRCPQHGTVYPLMRGEAQLSRHEWEPRCPHRSSSPCGAALMPLATAEGKPMHANSVYAIAKKTQEELVLTLGRAYHIPAVALRYFNTYGTRQALSNPYTGVAAIFSSRYLNGQPPMIFEDGQQMRDFVHVTDIAEATTLVLEDDRAQGVYNVGSGQSITIEQVADTIRQQMGAAQPPAILGEYRVGDIRHCYADISRLQALGYRPKVAFADGVAELVDWVQQQEADDTFESMKADLQTRGLTIG
jgi:dTDP-L-rhamnose 4-epimerase